MNSLLQWFGCAFGLLGALLVATNCRFSRWGFVAYLFSNAAWIAYSILIGAPGLLLQQVGFSITSLIGVWRWFTPTAVRRSSTFSVSRLKTGAGG
ncbi:MAG: hypothetical protein LBV49_04185 [Azonexus sp.]|nr:hypothetical protein [Azonexus sp.]